MNTTMEVSLPGFLQLDFKDQLVRGEHIGGGGFATIYAGTLVDPELQLKYGTSEVAIKVMQNEPSLTEEQNVQKFHQEIAIMWSVNSDINVISLIGYCIQPRCIITKLYKTDLFKLVHTETIDLTTAMAYHITRDIVSGMRSVHQAGVVHRDLKSPNILLETISENGKTFIRAVICDFGIARVTGRSTVTANKVFLNLQGLSPRYTAPEVFLRLKSRTQASSEEEKKGDVYSFAIVVWEMLTRKKPWDNCKTSDEVENLVRQGKREEIPTTPLKKTNSSGGVTHLQYFDTLTALVKRCWSQNPADRPHFAAILTKMDEANPLN